MTEAPERKYALSKVDVGDYVFVSNDGETIWRVKSYVDGPIHGLMEMRSNKTFWQILRYATTVTETDDVNVDDGTLWEPVSSMILTRREAIDEALGLENHPRP